MSATRSLRSVRLQGAAPRYLFLAASLVLALLGVRTLASPVPTAERDAVAPARTDTAAVAGFAERFARAYLSFDAPSNERRARALRALGLPADEDADAGSPRRSTAVVWSSVVGTHLARGRADVTVAVGDGSRTTYLAVPVGLDGAKPYVVAAPAIVGEPAVGERRRPANEWEVDDRALTAVVSRALRHYVSGDREDLAADFAAPVPPTPQTRLRVSEIAPPTWAVRGRVVAARIELRSPGGLRLALRYELTVVRRGGRWLVSDINHTTPKAGQ